MENNYRRFAPHSPIKFRWHDPDGRQLSAGGILPYDENGLWLIAEFDSQAEHGVSWKDIGGKYRFEDGDIYQTIAREFCEEVYNSAEITRKQILKIAKHYSPIYIDGHTGKPVYISYPVHISFLASIGIKLNPEEFLKMRKEILRSNPSVPPSYYLSFELKYMTYKEIANSLEGKDKLSLSSRLRSLIEQEPILTYLDKVRK